MIDTKVPDFILGGVQKSGTTLLHNLLMNHRQIKMLERNMDHAYFDDDRIYKRGKDWYISIFKDALKDKQEGKLIGQTSADCNFNPGAADRIMQHNPDCKLIFVLRNPVERTYSLYWHQYGMAREFRRFEEAIKAEPSLLKKSYYNFKNYAYLERSRYSKQFSEIMSVVPRKNILLLDFESLIKNTQETINEVLKFLNVETVADIEDLNFSKLPRNPAKIPTNHGVVVFSSFLQKIGLVRIGRRIVNLTRKEVRPPKMNDDTKKMLEEVLKDDIAFYNLVKNDFNSRISQG